MPTPAHTNTHGKGKHQKRQSDDAPLPVQSLSFRQSLRNVSSCTRCRQRKTRCDQQLPQCGTCEKAGARCVGYDPLMKREVPRSYLYYLEDRVEYFQNLLAEHGVSFEPGSSTMERSQDADPKDSHRRGNSIASTSGTEATVRSAPSVSRSPRDDLADTGSHLDVDIVRDKHDPGCCPAHELLFALQPSKSLAQSFVLPDRELAAQLITFYFEQGYPQVPALHKGELAQLLNQAYAGAEDNHHYNLFLLHIVFAIGARIMRDRNVSLSENDRPAIGKRKRDTETKVHLAEEYYSAAIAYLSLAFSECDDVSCKLEVIEAAVLIAHLSLFYPTRPGPVYLVGLALRAAVDAKLYDAAGPSLTSASCEGTVSNQDGKQQDQVLQRSRRLWWSAYSLDRLVSPYTGRPFAIPDHLITTAFPSMPEEMGVSCQGISPSNKLMNFLTTHLLQLRQLQSEIHEVLQYHHAQSVRSNSTVVPSTTSILSSPLDYFESFPSWKRDINRRLDEWKSCIPSREETGTWVPIVRLELDYWKTINLLYRHEVKVPSELGRLLPQSHLHATHLATGEGLTDDFTHFKIVEASRKVLQSYRLVHHLDSGNCTFLATHNIFLAGTLFLFAIWNSEMIRNILSLDEIDGTILTGTAVLASMADIHPQARECQDSLERMRVATMQMCLSSSKPGSGASPSKVPTVEVPSSTEDQVQLQPEQDILRGLGNANALTELFPVGDSSDIANANDNVDSIAPLIESQPRYFSNMGLPQTDKDESAFSLDFLDIELFPGRLSNDHGSILGR